MRYVIALCAVALASGCQLRQAAIKSSRPSPAGVYTGEIGHRNPSRGTTTVFRVTFVIRTDGSGQSVAKSDGKTQSDDFRWEHTTDGLLLTYVEADSVQYLLQSNTLFSVDDDGTRERFMVLNKKEMPNQTGRRWPI